MNTYRSNYINETLLVGKILLYCGYNSNYNDPLYIYMMLTSVSSLKRYSIVA